MSLVTSPYALPAALRRADDIIGPNRQWNPANSQQRLFLQLYEIVRDEVTRVPEIESIAAWRADEINEFLRQRGFSIHLPPFPPDNFGLAATFMVLLKWIVAGKELELIAPDRAVYPGVLVGDRALSYTANEHSEPVIGIPTQNEDWVYLTMLDPAPVDELAMISTARQLSASLQPGGKVEVHFPKVALDVSTELGWLPGLWTTTQDGRRTALVHGLRQTKVRMNQLGVRIEEAVAVMVVGMALAAEVHRHVINRPFLMWVTRPGLSLPLFVGYISREDWKDPGAL